MYSLFERLNSLKFIESNFARIAESLWEEKSLFSNSRCFESVESSGVEIKTMILKIHSLLCKI